MIKFLFLVNKQGQTRVSRYYTEEVERSRRTLFEAQIVRKCLSRGEKQCSFIEFENCTVVYRRYESLFFLVGIDDEENELGIYELIHNFVQSLERYFQDKFQKSVNEWDIMYNIEVVHSLLNEMVCSGYIIETNQERIVAPLNAIHKFS